jgi:hypothetical protein
VKNIVDEKRRFEILILLVVGIFLLFHGTKNLWGKWDIKKDGMSSVGMVIDLRNIQIVLYQPLNLRLWMARHTVFNHQPVIP